MTAQLSAPVHFVGRGPLLRRLSALYRSGQCVLLSGAAGSGKTTLIRQLAQSMPVFYALRCNRLLELLEVLEEQTRITSTGFTLAERVHRLAARLPMLGRPLVIDHVTSVPPRIAHLIRVLTAKMPVWLVTRSSHPLEVGQVWPYLFIFKPVNLGPFSLDESKALLDTVPDGEHRGLLLSAALRLHRLASGHPGTLAALIAEMAVRRYDLTTLAGLHRLALHARITGVEAQLVAVKPGKIRPRGRQVASLVPGRTSL